MEKMKIGDKKEIKEHPCPECGNTVWLFMEDGFSCVRCGHLEM